MEEATRCLIYLLGTIQVKDARRAKIPRFRSQRTQALLGYLIVAGRPVARQQLTALFWPDLGASKAKANLRRELHNLSRILPGCWDNAQTAVHFTPAPGTRVDVYEARRLAGAGEWVAATQWLRGAFLEGVALRGNLEAESWLQAEREHWRLLAEEILLKAAQVLWPAGAVVEAKLALARLLQLSPWHEEAHRQLMQLLARQGTFGAAIRQYRRCEELLQNELGVPPSPATQLLYKRIVAGRPFSDQGGNAGKDEPVIPLIGRYSQWERVQQMTASLRRGDSRCLWIFGEAGIGKTRFAEELLRWAYLNGYQMARTRSYGAHGDLAYAPVAQLLRSSGQMERIAQLDAVWLTEIARILPELLVDRPELPQPGPLSQGGRSVRFYEALCNAVLTGRQPIMLLFDDLQWCDEETLAWLHYLLRRQHSSCLLVVGCYRDDEIGADHPLKAISHTLYQEGQLTEIGLLPLKEEDAAQLAEAVYEKRLNVLEQRDLLRSANGNPLFIVELMRARLSGAYNGRRDRYAAIGSAASMDLPPKIFALIQYRLGRLSSLAQETAKVAAMIGRSFEHRLLLEASRATEETVVDALAELCEKRIIREQKAGVFDFTHDKLRDVAVAQVGGIHKRLLSRNIAEAYESLYEDRLDDIVGELAVAYEGAGRYPAAVSYYHQAAQAENRRGAYKRAESYLEKALALIGDVAERSDLAAIELTLLLSLGNVARVIRRNTVPKARVAFARALELSEAAGDQPGRFQALFGLAQYHMTDAELAQAGDFCRQSIAVAEQIDDEASLIRASLMFGFICLIRGEFRLAKENLERVCSHYSSDLAGVLTTLPGEDTGVMANIYLSCALWFLGYAEQSDEKMAVAQAIARERSLPINLAFVCFYQMMLSQIKHDIPAARRFANRLVAMSEHYDIGFALIAGRVGQAYVAASLDPDNRRLTESFEQLLATYHEQVSALSQPFFLALKARLLMAAERYEEAQAALTQAIALMDAIDDRYSAAEVYRLQGELWAVTGGGDPEAVYLQAIALAGEQQAKMPQIRAAVSLCRLWQRHGKQQEVHGLLSAIYDWFSEGFATTELQEARALLDELAPS